MARAQHALTNTEHKRTSSFRSYTFHSRLHRVLRPSCFGCKAPLASARDLRSPEIEASPQALPPVAGLHNREGLPSAPYAVAVHRKRETGASATSDADRSGPARPGSWEPGFRSFGRAVLLTGTRQVECAHQTFQGTREERRRSDEPSEAMSSVRARGRASQEKQKATALTPSLVIGLLVGYLLK